MHLFFFCNETSGLTGVCSRPYVARSNVGRGLTFSDGGGKTSINTIAILRPLFNETDCGCQGAIGEARQQQWRVPSMVTAWSTVPARYWEKNRRAGIG